MGVGVDVRVGVGVAPRRHFCERKGGREEGRGREGKRERGKREREMQVYACVYALGGAKKLSHPAALK